MQVIKYLKKSIKKFTTYTIILIENIIIYILYLFLLCFYGNAFLARLIINKDKILDGILLIDIVIISILLFNFNFYLIILDAVFSSILIFDIFVDIIRNNNENKKQLLKKWG